MGEAPLEQYQEDHGTLTVEGVQMSASRRLDVATRLREVFEDRRMRIPADDALRNDLHAIRVEPGATGAPRLVADRSGTDGHADRFWAMALAVTAAADTAGPFGARVGAGRHGVMDGPGSGHEIDVTLGVAWSALGRAMR